MSLSIVFSRALLGTHAPEVRVETHLAPGLPAFHIVGLADTEVRESRERVRAAIQRIGLGFPAGRITVNLSPAELPKESGRFDLPIAIGILLAAGQIDASGMVRAKSGKAGDGLPGSTLAHVVFAGELSLSGALVDISAPLTIALGVAADLPEATLILPPGSAQRAAQVPGLTVLAAPALDDVVRHLCGQVALPHARAMPFAQALDARCLSDVRGQPEARRALEIAASGGHSLVLSGPPGVGKSMLAQRLPGILPPLSAFSRLAVAARMEHAGVPFSDALGQGRPFRAPHHSATVAAIVGGGKRIVPGEMTLAHDGVLFLDELPEFGRPVLEALREPLETGWINLSRAANKVRYPAKVQLIAAMNPCPCGWSGHPRRSCACTPDQIARYLQRLSGPLLDRIDMRLSLPDCGTAWLDAPEGETSGDVRVRVSACHSLQISRQGCLNTDLQGAALAEHAACHADAEVLLRRAIHRWDWSARAAQRALRVARTLADMSGAQLIGETHLAQASQYRQSVPTHNIC